MKRLTFEQELDQLALETVCLLLGLLVVKGNLRSRLLVSERFQRNCLNTHCDG